MFNAGGGFEGVFDRRKPGSKIGGAGGKRIKCHPGVKSTFSQRGWEIAPCELTVQETPDRWRGDRRQNHGGTELLKRSGNEV
jgi:hypothetical protein